MKTYTYDPNAPKWEYDTSKDTTDAWTHGAVFGHTHAGNHEDKWRLLPELPFWWFLNPWKHVETLHDTLRDTVNDCNDWHKRYDDERAASKADAAERDEAVERLWDELEAANETIKRLKKARRK